MLHCQIITTSDLSLVRVSVSRPNESVAEYSPLTYPYETPLHSAMKARFGEVEALTKVFSFTREAASQLGEWCADQVWYLALAEDDFMKVERKAERLFLKDKENSPISILDAELKLLREAKEFINQWTFPSPSCMGNSLSPKVLLLQRYLELIYEKPTDARCIIFVKRRYTARVLALLFSRIGTAHLRLGSLIGTRYGDIGDVKVSFRQQILTLNKFRKGDINCLVCTLGYSTLREI